MLRSVTSVRPRMNRAGRFVTGTCGDGTPSHGAGVLARRGLLPAGSEFGRFRDVLDDRRAHGLAWVGGDAANAFDRDDAEDDAPKMQMVS